MGERDQRIREKEFEILSDSAGDYELCFYNQFSTITPKEVYLDMIFSDAGGNRWFGESDELNTAPGAELEWSAQVKEASARLSSQIHSMNVAQHHVHNRIVRNQHQIEDNNWKVKLWSLVEIVVMVLVAGLQVLAV